MYDGIGLVFLSAFILNHLPTSAGRSLPSKHSVAC
jgi:hypothetical protein